MAKRSQLQRAIDLLSEKRRKDMDDADRAITALLEIRDAKPKRAAKKKPAPAAAGQPS